MFKLKITHAFIYIPFNLWYNYNIMYALILKEWKYINYPIALLGVNALFNFL